VHLRCCGSCEAGTPALRWQCAVHGRDCPEHAEERCNRAASRQMGANVPLEKIAPAVPETLQQLIQVQFEQLSMSEQGILRSASVAGDRFSVWALTGALEIESSRIEDACEVLAKNSSSLKPLEFTNLRTASFLRTMNSGTHFIASPLSTAFRREPVEAAPAFGAAAQDAMHT